MTDTNLGANSGTTVAKLPRYDWILLPLLAVFTICILAIGAELTARSVYTESQRGLASCFIINDPITGVRGIPNSACWEKGLETERMETRFNSCGYAAGMECGPKPPNTYRIVMTGSSVALGEHVPRESTFAALLPVELSRRTGKKIDLYNEGMGFGFSHNTVLRFNDVLAAQPDVILWILTPSDVASATFVLPKKNLAKWNQQSFLDKIRQRVKANFSSGSFSTAVVELFDRTRTAFVVHHWMNQSQSQYVKSYLIGSDDHIGFLRPSPSPLWEGRLQQFDHDATIIEGRAKGAGIPFVAVFVPTRAQSAMISMNKWPAGFDPYMLNNQLRTIITSHGGIYLDILPDFRSIPNPEQYYLPVDGHPTAQGHAILTRLLANALTSGAIPDIGVVHQHPIQTARGQ